MSIGGWIALCVVVAALCGVLFGPLYALMSLLRGARNRLGYKRFCRQAGIEVPRRYGATRLSPQEPSIYALLYTPDGADKELGEGSVGISSGLGAEGNLFVFPRVKASSEGTLAVWVECDLPCSFALTRESVYDTVSKAATLDREFQTGDPEFDREVFISCEDVAFVRRYFTPERRKALLALLSDGISQVRYVRSSRRFIMFCDSDYLRRSDLAAPSMLISALQGLAEQSSGGVATVSSPTGKPDSSRRNSFGLGWGIVAIPIALALILPVLVRARYDARQILSGEPVFSTTAAVSAAILALLFLWRLRRVRGTSTARQSLVRLLVPSALIIPALIFGSIVFGNSLLDFSAPYEEPAIFQGVVARLQRTRLRRYREYPAAEFTINRGEHEPERVEIRTSEERAESLKGKEGHQGYVILKRGAFGLDYGVDFSVKP